MKKKIIFFSVMFLSISLLVKAQTIESKAYIANSNLSHHSQIIHNFTDDLYNASYDYTYNLFTKLIYTYS